jgi:hypothetical protein
MEKISIAKVNHSSKIEKCERQLKVLKMQFLKHITENNFTGDKHDKLFDETVKLLFCVGQLSEDVFNLSDELLEYYNQQHPHSAQDAKNVYKKEYSSMHKPYDRFKNNCYSFLEELDEGYFKLNGEQPPNYVDYEL